jgi:hypothetical protein
VANAVVVQVFEAIEYLPENLSGIELIDFAFGFDLVM